MLANISTLLEIFVLKVKIIQTIKFLFNHSNFGYYVSDNLCYHYSSYHVAHVFHFIAYLQIIVRQLPSIF